VAQHDVDVVVGRGDPGQLVGEDLVLGRAGVVQEGDAAAGATVVPVAQQGAQDRHGRGDARAAGEEEQVVVGGGGRALLEHEVALGLREVDDVAGLGALDQPARDRLAGTGLALRADGDRDGLPRQRGGRGDREAAGGAAAARQVDADLDVLVLTAGLAVDREDAGADLVRRPHRVDLLEVAVHAVRGGECGDRAGAEDGAGEAHDISCRG
jgi:hypothetical protein